MKDERGITALETAIILIASVVAAAIFASTLLSTGTFLTERSKEAAYAGLQQVRGSMELWGGMLLSLTAEAGDTVVFNLAMAADGSSVDLTKVKMTYRDSTRNTDLEYESGVAPTTLSRWTASNLSPATGAVTILSSGNLAMITLRLPAKLTANQTFALEIKPPTGGILRIERTCPAKIDTVTDLH